MLGLSAAGPPPNPVRVAIGSCRLAFIGVAVISGVINVLAMTGSLYMLQIYDRVLPSRSVPTLVGLTVLMIGLYLGFGLLDYLRTRIMGRIGLQIDQRLREATYKAVVRLPLRARQSGDGLHPMRDLDMVRAFFSSAAPAALFDIPWMPVYLVLLFILHSWLGLLAVAGALTLLSLALVTEWRGRLPSRAAAQSASVRQSVAEAARRNAGVIRAMGMEENVGRIWQDANARHLTQQVAAAQAGSGLSAVSRFLRMLLQSAMLGLGALLVIREEA